MFFGKGNKWTASVKKLLNKKLSVQAFVNANEHKTLYYSTPFIANEQGGSPNALQRQDSDDLYFPVFTAADGLRAYMTAIGCAEHILIKGDLKGVLESLDSHPALTEWGVVIDPDSPSAVEIPPRLRVQPKCLR